MSFENIKQTTEVITGIKFVDMDGDTLELSYENGKFFIDGRSFGELTTIVFSTEELREFIARVDNFIDEKEYD